VTGRPLAEPSSPQPSPPEAGGEGVKQAAPTFFGPRSWPVMGVFIVLGITNAMKGPLFGTAFLASAIGVYFIAGRHWDGLRRYVWFWGWLAYLVVGAAWPLLAYSRHPEVADVWMNDYGKRLNEGYIGEPPWYYLIHVPWNLFPWTLPAFVGLWVTARKVFRDRDRPWQFLWTWALVPPAVFSVFQGKHHHYMLNCIAPWAAIAVAGAVTIWRRAQTWPAWLRSPAFGLLALGVPGAIGAVLLAKKIPGPEWVAYTVAVGWPVVAAAGWYFGTHRNARIAFVGFLGVILVVHTAAYLHRTAYLDSYAGDKVFLGEVQQIVPADAPVYVLNEWHPLNAAWPLYYLGPRAHLLHHITYLSGDRITAPEVYVIGRRFDEAELGRYGEVSRLAESARTRAESSPMDRYTLYRVRFFPDLMRYPEPAVNGMQATGRARGPVLPGPERH
jgi:4-amino-4-deoxy-L-arabinose transferase-like glycosyltransferase